jgi:hypothetical protein
MANSGGGGLKTLATLVTVAAGVIGIYKACHNDTGPPARIRVVSATRKILPLVDDAWGRGGRHEAVLKLVFTNTSEHEAVNVIVSINREYMPAADEELRSTVYPSVLPQHEYTAAWDSMPSDTYYKGEIAFTDGVTNKHFKESWCFLGKLIDELRPCPTERNAR